MTDSTRRPAPRREQLIPPRPQLLGAMVSLAGWVVMVIPILAVSLIIFAAVVNPDTSIVTVGRIALIILGAALLFCMIAAPHLLGQAVIHRERDMWKAALWTGIPTICVIFYLAFRWLLNL